MVVSFYKNSYKCFQFVVCISFLFGKGCFLRSLCKLQYPNCNTKLQIAIPIFFWKVYDLKTKILQHMRYHMMTHQIIRLRRLITCRGHGQSQGCSHCPGIPAEAPPGQHDIEDQVLVPCTNLVGTSPTSAKSILILFASPPRGNPLISFTAVVAASMLSYWIVAHPSSTL